MLLNPVNVTFYHFLLLFIGSMSMSGQTLQGAFDIKSIKVRSLHTSDLTPLLSDLLKPYTVLFRLQGLFLSCPLPLKRPPCWHHSVWLCWSLELNFQFVAYSLNMVPGTILQLTGLSLNESVKPGVYRIQMFGFHTYSFRSCSLFVSFT